MASLLGELGSSPDMKRQFESLVKELGDAVEKEVPDTEASSAAAGTGKGESTASAGPEESFQETIRKTMERMQNSGEQATAAATSANEDDLLAQMLKEMQSGGGPDGAGNEEDFSKMLMGMMEQLTNKDILYEPLKELNEKFPAWMDKNKGSTPKDDLKRYEEQQTLVGEIVARFEDKEYSDSNAAHREYIVERMQKVWPN